jgi:hypothetical protein
MPHLVSDIEHSLSLCDTFPMLTGFEISLYAQILESAGDRILEKGILGAMVVAEAIAIFWLWRDGRTQQLNLQASLQRLNEQRIADAKAVQDQLLANNTACVTALGTSTYTMQEMKETNDEMKEVLRYIERILRERKI